MGKLINRGFIAVLLFTGMAVFAQDFKIVLDAGHGGHDTGTNHNGHMEKEIVLKTVLKIGKILEREPGFDVIYTRKTDVFVELRERANIANKENADLFVSIHCNGVNAASAYGTETFVMGLYRAGMNLEVAKKENSVIYQEKDYQKKYKGFDPNSADTYIGLSVQQDENLNQSVVLATKIRDGFRGLKKNDRGIKQIPLWVLDATTMPGVLVELGFVSHKTEGAYLDSEAGQDELAQTIADAIIDYKNLVRGKSVSSREYEKKRVEKDDVKTVEVKTEKTAEKSAESVATIAGVVFKVQISASNRNLDTKPANFKGLKNISKEKEGKLIRYFYGETSDYDESKELLAQAKKKGYDSAYIVPFKNGEIISMGEALKNL
ncbi:N-acetylmuramoyl-L-alanine amidase family protein [Flavobacterium sp. RHBU_3]|uniref:N-acetylmuramoyl-L-alanine amidase family protein n=1 Tax=Flavobacterium sp. RHBU_3 TaxID=3391184 RepID=UPI003984DEC6